MNGCWRKRMREMAELKPGEWFAAPADVIALLDDLEEAEERADKLQAALYDAKYPSKGDCAVASTPATPPPPSPRRLFGMTVGNAAVQDPLEQALEALKTCGPSREFSLVRTKIEEALLWLKAAERGDAFSVPPGPSK